MKKYCSLAGLMVAMSANASERPNVIVIIADQWSAMLSDASGNYTTNLRTPNVDRLAKDGIRFTQSYTTYPLSTPARACIYTSLYAHNHKAIFNENLAVLKDSLPADVTTMGRMFKEAGYNTAYFGKQHAANYAGDGIDEFGSFVFSDGGMLAEGSAYDPIFTRDAVDYIKKDHDKPFYMNLSLINPHDICKVLGGKVMGATFADAIFFCRDAKERYLRGEDRVDLPANFDIPYIKGMILDEDFMYKEVFEKSEDEWRRYISTYCLLMENTDWLIGLLLDSLDEAGLTDNTIVVFTTDHGDMMGSHKLIAKTTHYEESAKSMMCLRYPPKIKAKSVNDSSLVGSIDLMPTLLDMCGIDTPKNIDGRSFKAACYGQESKDHKVLYSTNYFGRMVRFDHYKFIRSEVYGTVYNILIDLERDPMESKNVYGEEGYKKISRKADKLLSDWIDETGIGLTFSTKWM